LKVDLVSTLRLVIDHAGEVVLDGGTADLGRLVTAVEHLTRMLPAAREPQQTRSDPREEMWLIYKTMRERGELPLQPDFQGRIAELEAENAALKAGSAPTLGHDLKLEATSAPVPPDVPMVVERMPIDPAIGDIVPPSEIGDCYTGQRPGPDDPPTLSVIEGKAVPISPKPPQTWDDTPHGKAWRAWHDAGGDARFDRWSNRNE
jgi:hypothetical protein